MRRSHGYIACRGMDYCSAARHFRFSLFEDLPMVSWLFVGIPAALAVSIIGYSFYIAY